MKNLIGALVAITALGSAASGGVQAATYQGSAGLASPDQTITFSEVVVSDFQSIGTAYSAFGVSFQNVFQRNGVTTFPNFSGPTAQNYGLAGCFTCSPFEVDFTAPVKDAVFALITNPGTSLFQSFLGATLVDSFSVSTTFNDPNNFFGFTSSLFDRILVTAGDTGAARFDNIEFNAAPASTPLPAALPLFASGLGALGLLGWHRKRKSTALGA